MRLTNSLFQKYFLDKLKLTLISGDGANGNPKLGGKGGNGGNIFLVGSNSSTLENIRNVYPGLQIKVVL